jgi:nitroreductase
MIATLPDRTADTAAALHPLLAGRWSPRGFDGMAELGEAELDNLLEAARWAPSAANLQPWRFIVGRRADATFERIVAVLADGNKAWAPNASLLIVAVAATVDGEGKPQRWAEYDTGQAVAHLSLQAEALGLNVHQMGGFDPAGLVETFALAEGFVPISVTAIGRLDPDAPLPDYLHERERAPRVRRPLAELLIA